MPEEAPRISAQRSRSSVIVAPCGWSSGRKCRSAAAAQGGGEAFPSDFDAEAFPSDDLAPDAESAPRPKGIHELGRRRQGSSSARRTDRSGWSRRVGVLDAGDGAKLLEPDRRGVEEQLHRDAPPP